MRKEGILCVITGMEKSGTTFLSKLLASDPAIMCGFECGLLLSNIRDFSQVQPFFSWMTESADIGHWGIPSENLHEICSAESYHDAYRRIKKHAGSVGSSRAKDCFRNAKWVLDKTPKYIFHLESVMKKIDVPFIVIEKDIVLQYVSFAKRKIRMEDFIVAYSEYRYHLRLAKKEHADRLLVVSYEELMKNQEHVMKEISHFLDIPYYARASLNEYYQKTGLQMHGGLRENVSQRENRVKLHPFKERMLYFLGRRSVYQLKIVTSLMPHWIALKIALKKSIDAVRSIPKPK